MIDWKISRQSEPELYLGIGVPHVMAVTLAILPGPIEATLGVLGFYIPAHKDDDARDEWFCNHFFSPWAECLEHVWQKEDNHLLLCLRSIRPVRMLGPVWVGELGGIAHRYADQLHDGVHPGALS